MRKRPKVPFFDQTLKMPLPTTLFNLPTQWRQAIFYGFLLIGTGASLPYMPLWFASKGMSGAQIGLILAIPLLLRAVSGPVIGVWADRFRLYRTPMIFMAATGGSLYALLALWPLFDSNRFLMFVIVWLTGFSCTTSMTPQTDAMTMELSRREGFDYSRSRAVGSVCFIVTNISVGFLLKIFGVDLILIWVVMAASLTALAARFILPAAPRLEVVAETQASETQASEISGWARVRVLARNADFIWLMIALGCIQAAHAFYYGFSSLIWKGEGHDGLSIGYLWATGVSTEVLMLAFGLRLRRRFGAWNLLLAAGGFSVLRWAVMAFSPPLWLLWPLQMLHALSFAACYLAGLELTRAFAPEGYANLAQTISAAYVMGVMMGLATLAAGPVYDVLGAGGYGVMAGMAATGFCVSVWLYRRRAG